MMAAFSEIFQKSLCHLQSTPVFAGRYEAWESPRGRRDRNLLLHFRKEICIIDCKVDSDNPVAKYASLCKDYISILLVCIPDMWVIWGCASWYSWWCRYIWTRKRKALTSSLVKSLLSLKTLIWAHLNWRKETVDPPLGLLK